MSDISNLLIKDSYDYVIQVDPITRQVLRIGGSIPDNPIFVSGLTVQNSFKFTNGTESSGYVLKCDSQGNAKWAPVNVSGNTYALTGVTIDGFTLTFTDSEGELFPITITGGTLWNLNVTGDTVVNNLSADTIYLSGTNVYDIFLTKDDVPQIKNGKIAPTSFTGQPYTTQVVFNTVLTKDYTITVTGKDLRIWSVENEGPSGFTINSNSNVPLSDNTFWQVMTIGEFL